MAALQPAPSRRLHNFSFPDIISRWGSTRQLRCCKVPFDNLSGSGEPLSPFSSPEKPLRFPTSPNMDTKSAAVDVSGDEDEVNVFSPALSASRPWNLRSRRAACKAPLEIGRFRNPGTLVVRSPSHSHLQKEKVTVAQRSVRLLRSEGCEGDKVEKRKFSVELLQEEIEEDFHVFKGRKPPRRPKKRPRLVQKKLDSLFPGLWLSDVTLDSYKVDE